MTPTCGSSPALWPAGGSAAVVCSATFDSFSFPTFVGTTALIMGLVGALWVQQRDGQGLQQRLASAEDTSVAPTLAPPAVAGTTSEGAPR